MNYIWITISEPRDRLNGAQNSEIKKRKKLKPYGYDWQIHTVLSVRIKLLIQYTIEELKRKQKWKKNWKRKFTLWLKRFLNFQAWDSLIRLGIVIFIIFFCEHNEWIIALPFTPCKQFPLEFGLFFCYLFSAPIKRLTKTESKSTNTKPIFKIIASYSIFLYSLKALNIFCIPSIHASSNQF